MLITRIITALVLVVVLGAGLAVGFSGFVTLILLFMTAAVWEWMRLLQFGPRAATFLSLFAAGLAWFLCFEATTAVQTLVPLILALVGWLFLAAQLSATRRFTAVPPMRTVYATFGIVAPAACAMAVIRAYQIYWTFVVSILVVVWAADVGAYFTGKAIGRHKLAPAISPGKTIEGVLGGMVLVALLALVTSRYALFDDTFSSRLLHRLPVAVGLIVLALIVALSVVGDLFESHLKRQAGVKDSSGLLPGHGGVLDRLDAVLPVVPTAVVIAHFL